MNITKRLYTYPILTEEKDDYVSSIFDVQVTHSMNGVSNLHLVFDITMDNKDIQQLILQGKAEYVIHIECSNTAFRTTLSCITDKTDIDIPIGRLNGKLELIALIIAKVDIQGFTNSTWNEDYDGITFDITKGSILGYKNLLPLDVIKNFEELSNGNSIFMVYKRLTVESKPMDVNIDGAQIKIGLGTQEYEVYSRFCKKTQFQPILNSMLILPALTYVFEELKQDNGVEANEGKNWFVSLNKAYEKRGIDFIREIREEEKTSIQLAQEAMELPLNSALSMLSELYEDEEEDD